MINLIFFIFFLNFRFQNDEHLDKSVEFYKKTFSYCNNLNFSNNPQEISISKCKFIHTKSPKNGGAIFSIIPINITKTTFEFSSANSHGGCIYSTTNIFISFSVFSNCTAKISSCIFLGLKKFRTFGQFQMNQNIFVGCHSKHDGIIKSQEKTHMSSNQINQTHCNSDGYHGGIFCTEGRFSIKNFVSLYNSAEVCPGLGIGFTKSISISQCLFSHNSRTSDFESYQCGGLSISIIEAPPLTSISNCSFMHKDENIDPRFPPIWVKSGSKIQVNNCCFSDPVFQNTFKFIVFNNSNNIFGKEERCSIQIDFPVLLSNFNFFPYIIMICFVSLFIYSFFYSCFLSKRREGFEKL